jgi:diguanylate cyclase (GGDEF)-like protein/PAS domain S-box-containing protein
MLADRICSNAGSCGKTSACHEANSGFTQEGVLVVRDGIIEASDTVVRRLLQALEGLRGQPLSRFFPEFSDRMSTVHCLDMASLAGCQGVALELGGVRVDGSRFDAVVTVRQVSHEDGSALQLRVRSASAQRFEQVLLQNERDVLDLIASRAPIQQVLETLCHSMESVMPQARCLVTLRVPDEDVLVCVAAPSLPESLTQSIGRIPISPLTGVSGAAAAARAPVLVTDVRTDPRWETYRSLAIEGGVHSAWAIPFFAPDGDVAGTISVYYEHSVSAVTELEERLVSVSVRLAEVAIQSHVVRQTLLQRESELRTVVNTVGAAIVTLDASGVIRDANRGAAELTARPLSELVGMNVCTLLAGATDAAGFPLQVNPHAVADWFTAVAQRRNTIVGFVLPTGCTRWISLNLAAMEDTSGSSKQLFVCSGVDVSEMKRTQERLAQLASHDELTGLPNRAALADATEKLVETARRSGDPFAMLVLDLDGFKHVNDTLGHAAGDQLLKELSARMAAVVRLPDMIARRSGDEFVVLLRHTDATGAGTVARRLLSVFDTPVNIGTQEVFASVSIGGAVYPMHGTTSDALFRSADSAMYAAKRAGRGRIVIHDTYCATKEPGTHRIAMEAQLRRALGSNELSLYYQPRVCARTRRMVSAEALVRWTHPERGMVSPVEFIPLAEETGLIIPLGEWVLHEACRQGAAWHRAGHTQMRISVNVSPKQFNAQFLAEDVPRILANTGFDPKCLELEVTETAMMAVLSDDAMDALVRLRERGVQLVLDDFGTGYSSLSYLHRFPLDGLKVDRSFVQRLPEAADARAITHAVLSMAQALNLHTVAEGVETEAQRDWLRERGCHEFQGFLYSKPVPAAELERRFWATMSCDVPVDCDGPEAERCAKCADALMEIQGLEGVVELSRPPRAASSGAPAPGLPARA